LLAGLDPQWVGINLHSGVPEMPGRDVLAMVKAVSISDADGREPRPLGKGATDFGKLFGALANAGFSGPITVYRNYKTADQPGALSRDCEFARKQIQSAYTAPKT
jgi:sugar phosphate isomerase/epimerase